MLHVLHAATEVKKSVPKEVQKFLPQAGSVYEAKKVGYQRRQILASIVAVL